MLKKGLLTCDPGKPLPSPTCDKTCALVSCDPGHDSGKPTPDQPRDWSATQLPNKSYFGKAKALGPKWQTIHM